MPEKTAIKTNNYAIMPISTLLAATTVVLLFLKVFGVVSVSWWIVFSPVLIWMGVVFTAGIIFVTIIAMVALFNSLK